MLLRCLVVNRISSDYGVQDGVRFEVSSPAALPQSVARFRAQAALPFVYFSWAESSLRWGRCLLLCAERSMHVEDPHFSHAPVQAFPKTNCNLGHTQSNSLRSAKLYIQKIIVDYKG